MDDRSITVLYGSQTGTAQDVAERVSRDAKRRHFNTHISSLDGYDVGKLIREKLVVFVVATTGQGDPPENMLKFWRFILRKNLPSNSLQSIQSAVLGLGDSSYQKFNFIGKKLHKRLEQLGAELVLPVGLADEQHDLGQEAVIDPWMTSFWNIVMEKFPLPAGQSLIPAEVLLPPKFRVEVIDGKTETVSLNKRNGLMNSDQPYNEQNPFYATLLGNERVTAEDHFQDVRLIKLDLLNSGIQYEAGDVLYIAPKNKEADVKEFLQLVNLDGNQLLHLVPSDPLGAHLPKTVPLPCSWYFLAENYLDICGTPKRYFWELLAQFANSEIEREKFTEFLTAEGQEDLFDYVHRPRRTLLEVLADFPDAARSIPKEYIFDMIPVLQPRAFSIASSPKMHPNEAQLLMAVVRYKSKRLVKLREGVCSTWLAALKPGHSNELTIKIPVWIKKGTIRFPQDSTPVVMVGPGTGVAPFRNFIQERIARKIGNNVLFFGCRNRSKDYYCEREWTKYVDEGLLKIFTAFSRDQADKEYVQHKIKEQGEMLWDLIHNQNAQFCIAGNSKNMPDAVREALKGIIMKHGGKSDLEAEAYLRDMDKSQHYQAETWS